MWVKCLSLHLLISDNSGTFLAIFLTSAFILFSMQEIDTQGSLAASYLKGFSFLPLNRITFPQFLSRVCCRSNRVFHQWGFQMIQDAVISRWSWGRCKNCWVNSCKSTLPWLRQFFNFSATISFIRSVWSFVSEFSYCISICH